MEFNLDISLLMGEKAIETAPCIQLNDGTQCIPQHYLTFEHDIKSVESLVLDIDFSDRYPVFVSEDETGLFIQVGIIGHDNYKNEQNTPKIVYGRKWRVEPQLPSSEIIQTVFLALKKAREHEVRELFRYQFQGAMTTPFNNHHDLPLLTNCADALFEHSQINTVNASEFFSTVAQFLLHLNYADDQFELLSIEPRRTGHYLFELKVEHNNPNALPEVQCIDYISFTLPRLDINLFAHQLMSHLISLSDRFVDEHFKFKGTARFSWETNVDVIADFSIKTRKLHKSEQYREFEQTWLNQNYSTDLTRVPQLSNSLLANKIRNVLNSFGELHGITPNFSPEAQPENAGVS